MDTSEVYVNYDDIYLALTKQLKAKLLTQDAKLIQSAPSLREFG